MAVLGHIWRIVAKTSLLRSKGSRVRVAPGAPISGGEPEENPLAVLTLHDYTLVIVQ